MIVFQSLVLLLVASALSAPAENAKPVVEVKEVKEAVEPQARALAITPYQPYQHQFGARLTPYYQPQHQYLAGQQHAYNYVQGNPTQVTSKDKHILKNKNNAQQIVLSALF